MYPFAFLEPSDVAWWNLWQSHEGRTGITHVSQTDGVPSRAGRRLFAFQLSTDVVGSGGNHRLNHVTGFRCASGDGGGFYRRNGDADTGRVDVFVFWVALMFIDKHKTTRVAEAFHGGENVNPFESGQHHGLFEFQFMLFEQFAFAVHFVNEHFAIFDFGGFGVGDPFDAAVAQFALQHAFGVTDTTKA